MKITIKKHTSLPLLVFLIGILPLGAQTPGKEWSLGGTLGVANYLGDLSPKNSAFSFNVDFTRTSFSFFAVKRVSDRFSVRAELGYSRIAGSDFDSADTTDAESLARYLRNLHFRNDLIEFSGKAVFDLIPASQNPKVVPYLMAGVSVFYSNPKALGFDPNKNYVERWVALQPLQTEGVEYSKIQLGIPLGIGVKYNVSNLFSIGLEFCYRQTFTDYLDDVSSDKYADLSGKSYLTRYFANRSSDLYNFYSDAQRPIPSGFEVVNYVYEDGTPYKAIGGFHAGEGGERRGDPSKKDQFFTGGITLSWVLGNEGEARYR